MKTPAALLFVALALVPLAAAYGPQSYILSLGAHALIFAMAALSLDFIVGKGAMPSFGHAAFLGIGAYAVVIASSAGVDEILWQFLIAIGAALVFALASGSISLRARGVYYIMSTLAFGQMLYFLAVSLSVYGGDDGVTLASRSAWLGGQALKNDTTFYYFSLAALFLAYLLLETISNSPFGRVLGALRQNPTRVEALGYRPFGYRLVATLISGAICAVAGVLLANQSEFVSPAFMTWRRSGELLVMVILGGIGSLWGAILGAIGYLLLDEFLSTFTEQGKLILGPLLILAAIAGRGARYGAAARGSRA
jgi:branched-chain amino acid transport system permease protein